MQTSFFKLCLAAFLGALLAMFVFPHTPLHAQTDGEIEVCWTELVEGICPEEFTGGGSSMSAESGSSMSYDLEPVADLIGSFHVAAKAINTASPVLLFDIASSSGSFYVAQVAGYSQPLASNGPIFSIYCGSHYFISSADTTALSNGPSGPIAVTNSHGFLCTSSLYLLGGTVLHTYALAQLSTTSSDVLRSVMYQDWLQYSLWQLFFSAILVFFLLVVLWVRRGIIFKSRRP